MTVVSVTVVPVGLLPVETGAQTVQLRVAALRPQGGWLSAPLSDGASAKGLAHELLAATLSADSAASLRLENVGAAYSDDAASFVLSTIVPISTPELDGSADWTLITPWSEDVADNEAEQLDGVQSALIRYWRGQLRETSAALDFLPAHFTVTQVRSVYASLWGERQNIGNFHRWLTKSARSGDESIITEVDEDVVRTQVQTEGAKRLAAATGVAAAVIHSNWDRRLVGTSAFASPLGKAASALMPAMATVGAVVGARVAFQRYVSAGNQPRWFRRTHEHRVPLDTLYATPTPPVNLASTRIDRP